MFIFWGTKRVDRTLGFAADHCPLCKCERPFKVIQRRMVSHIYYIGYGSGEIAGYTATCTVCRTGFETDPHRYSSFAGEPGEDIERLIRETFPRLRAVYEQQRALETIPGGAPLTLLPRDRQAILLEPFRLLEQEAAGFYNRTPFDKPSAIGCFGTIGLCGILLALALFVFTRNPIQGILGWAFMAVAALGIPYTLVRLALAPGRALRTRTIPKLAAHLAPLRPSRNELTTLFVKLREQGTRIGKKLDAETLLEVINAQSAQSPQPFQPPFADPTAQPPNPPQPRIPDKPIPFKPQW